MADVQKPHKRYDPIPHYNTPNTRVTGANKWKRRFIGTGGDYEDKLKEVFAEREKANTFYEKEMERLCINAESSILKIVLEYPELSSGVDFLQGLRVGKIHTGERLAIGDAISKEYLTKCYVENELKHESLWGGAGEDVVHTLLECPQWEVYREKMMTATGVAKESSRDSLETTTGEILGGEYGRIHEGEPCGGNERPLAVYRYLHTVILLRAAMIQRGVYEHLQTSRNRSLSDMVTLGDS